MFLFLLLDLSKEVNLVTKLDLILMKLTLWYCSSFMMSLSHQLFLVGHWTFYNIFPPSYNLLFCLFFRKKILLLLGNYDIIQQPKNVSESTKKNVPFYMFIDEETEAYLKNSSDFASSKKVGLWRIIVVHNIPYSDSRRNGKVSLFWYFSFSF